MSFFIGESFIAKFQNMVNMGPFFPPEKSVATLHIQRIFHIRKMDPNLPYFEERQKFQIATFLC
jgi:hypothetical protein